MKSQFRVGIFGISGVGKSSLIQRVMDQLPYESLHLQAGTLIKEAIPEQVTSDSLRTAASSEIQANQEILIEGYQNKLESKKHVPVVIFDGHSIIDNDREIIEIPPSVIQRLNLHCLAFVKEDPENICHHRILDTSRNRPSRSINKLRDVQEQALAVCQRYCQELNLPLHVISSSDDELLVSFISTGISDTPKRETN